MDEGESVLDMVDPATTRAAWSWPLPTESSRTSPWRPTGPKGNRKKLVGAYSDKSPLVGLLHLTEAADLFILTNDGRALVVNSSLLALKPTRNTQGVSVASLRGRKELTGIMLLEDANLKDPSRYRARTVPKAPVALTLEDKGEEQLSLL